MLSVSPEVTQRVHGRARNRTHSQLGYWDMTKKLVSVSEILRLNSDLRAGKNIWTHCAAGPCSLATANVISLWMNSLVD